MVGETRLERLIDGLTARLDPQIYVFVSCPPDAIPQGLTPLLQFDEAEGRTLILPEAQCRQHNLRGIFPCQRITLGIHSSLEAVGLIATISAALAQQKIPANPVSGYFHDHIFVPEDKADLALSIIKDLSKS
jgi:hypothetical protein